MVFLTGESVPNRQTKQNRFFFIADICYFDNGNFELSRHVTK